MTPSPRRHVLTFACCVAALAACAHPAPSDLSGGVVQRPAVLAENQPRPTYPAALIPERVQGTVQVRVNVLPSGRADSSTLVVIASPHALLTQAVEAVLPKLTFWSAQVGGTLPTDCHPNPPYLPTCNRAGKPGHKVAQQVELSFVFVPPSP
jgi:TonB family protein